jgi:hypothetical protein
MLRTVPLNEEGKREGERGENERKLRREEGRVKSGKKGRRHEERGCSGGGQGRRGRG